ncbi:MAG: hypothetical protein KC561_20635, partial [Myxococcales bacterium]|nr:hypothetical protein [Myxococcales bacterium]
EGLTLLDTPPTYRDSSLSFTWSGETLATGDGDEPSPTTVWVRGDRIGIHAGCHAALVPGLLHQGSDTYSLTLSMDWCPGRLPSAEIVGWAITQGQQVRVGQELPEGQFEPIFERQSSSGSSWQPSGLSIDTSLLQFSEFNPTSAWLGATLRRVDLSEVVDGETVSP